MKNIALSYMYRDGGNYKNHNSVIFGNPDKCVLGQIEPVIRSRLIDGGWFYIQNWGLKDLHFDKWDDEIDHTFHEFEGIEYTDEQPTDERTILVFLEQILSRDVFNTI
jgi:hypothetical protein